MRAWRFVVCLWRDPERAGWLMAAYFLLMLEAGPVITVSVSAPGGVTFPPGLILRWAIPVFLAWRVARGGRVSRMLLLAGGWAGYFVTAFAGHLTPPVAGTLAGFAAQLALLLSPAVYERTRPDGGSAAGRAWIWAWPPATLVVLGVFAGLGIALARWATDGNTHSWPVQSARSLQAGFRGVPGWGAVAGSWAQDSVIAVSLLGVAWFLVLSDWALPSAPGPRPGGPALLPVAVLTAVAVLSAAGAAVAVSAVADRVGDYASEVVYLRAGQPVTRTLPAGRYAVLGGCARVWGCETFAPAQLLASDARGTAVRVTRTGESLRNLGGQLWITGLSLAVPAPQRVRLALAGKAPRPALLAPVVGKGHAILGWSRAAAGSAGVLLADLACLEWLLRRRHRPGAPQALAPAAA